MQMKLNEKLKNHIHKNANETKWKIEKRKILKFAVS